MLYLSKYVNNIHTAEDLTEDTFVKIAVNKPRFSGKSSFKTWLYTIARNTAFDFLRRNRIHISTDEDLQIFLTDEINIESEYIKSEDNLLLYKALCNLNIEYRTVLYLSYFEDFNNAEIAKIMKKSNRQVENLLYRAKLRLKSELEKEKFVYEKL